MRLKLLMFTGFFVFITAMILALDRFTDNNDGTVMENASALIWQKCSMGQVYSGGDCTGIPIGDTGENALSYCENLVFAGFTTWRLPNINELKSIVDFSKDSPAIDTGYFPNTVLSAYWSSTTALYNTSLTWNVDFLRGRMNSYAKTDPYSVRCVSSGP